MGVPEERVSNRGMFRFFRSLIPKHCPNYILSLTERRAAASVSELLQSRHSPFPSAASHLGWPHFSGSPFCLFPLWILCCFSP